MTKREEINQKIHTLTTAEQIACLIFILNLKRKRGKANKRKRGKAND